MGRMSSAFASPGAFFDALEAEDSEVLIVSVLLDREEDGTAILRHGSAVIAPEECGRVAWGVWSTEETHKPMALCPGTAPASFIHDAGHWVAARAVLSLDTGRRWLARLTDAEASGTCVHWPASDGLPAFQARIQKPEALIRVLPGTDTAAGRYLASAKRPALGTIWRSDDRPELLVPTMVEYEGATYAPLTLCLLGLLVPTEGLPNAGPPPFGLFVGRLKRRAWLSDLEGDGPAFEAFHVYIGWDPARIDLSELVLDLEQFVGGELVNQLRAPLEDTIISDEVRTAGACITSLPTMGRGVASRVSLTTQDGALLDRIGPHHLVESVNIRVVANGQEQPPIVIGSSAPAPGLEERAERQQQVEKQAGELANQGAEGRLLVDRVAAEQRLRLAISSAREELLVHDPYFGQDADDWRLLDDVPVPVRVVTAKIAAEIPRIGDHVQARYRPKAPMHERFWIWRDGGVSVGGSPTTFGQSPVRIGRLTSADSDLLSSVFESLWQSELFQEVPRQR